MRDRGARERMLAAYGARIWLWPEARIAGVVGIIVNPGFRRRLLRERALDRAIALAAPEVRQPRLEGRLLAAMGFIEAGFAKRRGISFPVAAGLAAASLALGVLIGGIYGTETLAPIEYAGISEIDWSAIGDAAFLGESG